MGSIWTTTEQVLGMPRLDGKHNQ
eukprot:COSAG02_NODE_49487_length_326_cov_1.123348_1_plen_24_part_10